MTMTLDSFYETLAGLDLIWTVGGFGSLRCEAGDCPILAVHNGTYKGRKIKKNNRYYVAGEHLGLDYDDIENIVDAADWAGNDNRRRLLTACGLTG